MIGATYNAGLITNNLEISKKMKPKISQNIMPNLQLNIMTIENNNLSIFAAKPNNFIPLDPKTITFIDLNNIKKEEIDILREALKKHTGPVVPFKVGGQENLEKEVVEALEDKIMKVIELKNYEEVPAKINEVYKKWYGLK